MAARRPRQPNEALRRRREQLGLSKMAVAKALRQACAEGCGVDYKTVSRWENGVQVPSPGHQRLLCRMLAVAWVQRGDLGFLASPIKGQ